MRELLEDLGGDYEWYKIRRSKYDTKQKIPFLVSYKKSQLIGRGAFSE